MAWIGRLGLGRLPGEIFIQREGFTSYAPITTRILLSVALPLILSLFSRRGPALADFSGAKSSKKSSSLTESAPHGCLTARDRRVNVRPPHGGLPVSKIVNEVLEANRSYAQSFGQKSELRLPPVRGFAIHTCMDARIDPAKYAGLAEGDAHIIRNAGGRATEDAIRSLIIPQNLLAPMSGSSSITPIAG